MSRWSSASLRAPSTICCILDSGDKKLQSVPIPAFLADRIEPAPAGVPAKGRQQVTAGVA